MFAPNQYALLDVGDGRKLERFGDVIDVYDASSGQHLRTLGNFGQETPLILWVAQ